MSDLNQRFPVIADPIGDADDQLEVHEAELVDEPDVSDAPNELTADDAGEDVLVVEAEPETLPATDITAAFDVNADPDVIAGDVPKSEFEEEAEAEADESIATVEPVTEEAAAETGSPEAAESEPAPPVVPSNPIVSMPIGKAINKGLHDALANDPKVLLMGEDIGPLGGVYRVTEGLHAEFGPQRVLDTPLAESGIIGTAIGLAMRGYRPVCEIQFDGFIFPGFDQITTQLSRMRNRHEGTVTMPIVIRVPYGGHIGSIEHHSESPEAYFAHTPGLRVVSPSNSHDAYWMIQEAIASDDPVLFFEPKSRYFIKSEINLAENTSPLHSARVARVGTDVTVVAPRRGGVHTAPCRRPGGRGGDEPRGDRPALHLAHRLRARARLGAQDGTPRRRAGGQWKRERRIGDRGDGRRDAPSIRSRRRSSGFPGSTPPTRRRRWRRCTFRMPTACSKPWIAASPTDRTERSSSMSDSKFLLPDVGEGLTEAEIVAWKVGPGDSVSVNQVIVEIETAKSLVELPSPFEGVVGELLVSEGQTVDVGTAIITVSHAGAAVASARPGAGHRGAGGGDRCGRERLARSGYRTRRREGGGAPGRLRRVRPRLQPPASGQPPRHEPAAGDGPGSHAAAPTPASAGSTPRCRFGRAPHRPATKRRCPRDPPVITKPPIRKLAKDLGVDLAQVTPTGPIGDITRDDVLREATQATVFRNIADAGVAG